MDRLSAGSAFIDLSFRKPADHRSDIYAHLGNLGMVLYPVKRSAGSTGVYTDLDFTCSRLYIQSEFGCKDLNPGKLQPSKHLIVLHMTLFIAVLFILMFGEPSFTDRMAPCCILISVVF